MGKWWKDANTTHTCYLHTFFGGYILLFLDPTNHLLINSNVFWGHEVSFFWNEIKTEGHCDVVHYLLVDCDVWMLDRRHSEVETETGTCWSIAVKVKISPESSLGFICDWIWVKPSCKSIIMMKEALLRFTLASFLGKPIFSGVLGPMTLKEMTLRVGSGKNEKIASMLSAVVGLI